MRRKIIGFNERPKRVMFVSEMHNVSEIDLLKEMPVSARQNKQCCFKDNNSCKFKCIWVVDKYTVSVSYGVIAN